MLNTLLTSESEVLSELSQGSQLAFKKIYDFYGPRLYGKLLKMVKSESVASEILQDIFLKIWERRQDIDVQKSFRSYLFRIAENKAYDFFREAARNTKMSKELLKITREEYSHIEETLVSKENAGLLNEAINSLPPQRREIFILCKLDGKSYKEVSWTLGISTSTISDHIVKANNSIRKYLIYRL